MPQDSDDEDRIRRDADPAHESGQSRPVAFTWKDSDQPASPAIGAGGLDSESGKKAAAHAALRCPFNWKQVEDLAVCMSTLRAMDQCPWAKGWVGLNDSIMRLYPIVVKEMVASGEWLPGQFNHPPSEDSIRWRVEKPGNGHTVYQRFLQIKAPVKQHLLPWLKAECKADGTLPPASELSAVLKKIKQQLWEQVATPREKLSTKVVPSNWGFSAWVAFQRWGPHTLGGGHPAFCEGFEHLRTNLPSAPEQTTPAGSKRKVSDSELPEAQAKAPVVPPKDAIQMQASSGVSRTAMLPVSLPMPANAIPLEVAQHPGFAQHQFQHAAACFQHLMAQQQHMPPLAGILPVQAAGQQQQMAAALQGFLQAHTLQAASAAAPSDSLTAKQADLKLALEAIDKEMNTLVVLKDTTENENDRKHLLNQLRTLSEMAKELRIKAVSSVTSTSTSNSSKSGAKSVTISATKAGAAANVEGFEDPVVEVIRDPADMDMNSGRITIHINFKGSGATSGPDQPEPAQQ